MDSNRYKLNDGGISRLFVIPQDEQDYQLLSKVDNRTRITVRDKYGFILDYNWQSNTIANCLIENLILHLSFKVKEIGKGVGDNFFDLFSASVSIKRNEKAEKEGNINIYFQPGKVIDDLIKDGPDDNGPLQIKLNPEEVFKSDNQEDREFYKNLEYQTRYELGTNHGIMFPQTAKYYCFAIGYEFIRNLIIEMLYELSSKDKDSEEKMITVNFNENIEFHALIKDDLVTVTMRPGMNAKLLIKSDEITENTLDDDYDDED